MTAAATAAPETSKPSLEDLRARAGELKEQVETLESSLASSRSKLQDLLTERSTLVVPAHSGKDQGAQKRLNAIDEQSAVLKRGRPRQRGSPCTATAAGHVRGERC